MALEQIANNEVNPGRTRRILSSIIKTIRSKEYQADVLAGWLYYTTTYGAQEALLGKDFDSLMTTRLIGLATHAVVMRPVGKLRNYLAERWNVTEESQFRDKLKVNFAAITPIQSVVYAGILFAGMAISGKWDMENSFYSWVAGTGLGALHAFPAGWTQDRVRKQYGIEPAIKPNLHRS